MKELNLIVKGNAIYADSREIAELIGKRHDHLLRDIDSYVAILNQNPNLGSDRFFVKSDYISGTGKQYKCYLLTRKGCDMVANKMTGEKGVLFTAAYVERFYAMEEALRQPKITPLPKYRSRMVSTAVRDVGSTAKAIQEVFHVQSGIALAKATNMIEWIYGIDMEPVREFLPAATHTTGFLNPTQIGERIGISAKEVNIMLADRNLQRREGEAWRLNDAGKAYGEEMPYERNGHSGYQIRWNENVLSLLGGTQ